ncbi:WhiB family transcriptional regulator [Nocardia puris]|uniref:WhiB family transcriptional regulator n=1 Tax=Nocardia puris TaxID=208602 RepID=UPI001895A674|nr:WhiB family transcriptional regulator [Nocardia puris]
MSGGRPPSIPPLLAGLVDERLDGAACVRQAPWFDTHLDGETPEQSTDRHTLAARICRTCPVRAACDTTAAELAHRATGVWAGILRDPPAPRGRPKATP